MKSDSRESLVRGPSYSTSKAHSDLKCLNSLPAHLTGIWVWTGSRILKSCWAPCAGNGALLLKFLGSNDTVGCWGGFESALNDLKPTLEVSRKAHLSILSRALRHKRTWDWPGASGSNYQQSSIPSWKFTSNFALVYPIYYTAYILCDYFSL